jgi:hypothetical protein
MRLILFTAMSNYTEVEPFVAADVREKHSTRGMRGELL